MESARRSPSCTQHIISSCYWSVSSHVSDWDIKYAGRCDSALTGNSALAARIARAAGMKDGTFCMFLAEHVGVGTADVPAASGGLPQN